MKSFDLLSYFTLYFFLHRNTAKRAVIPQTISKPGMLVFFPTSVGIGFSLCTGGLTFAGVLTVFCGLLVLAFASSTDCFAVILLIELLPLLLLPLLLLIKLLSPLTLLPLLLPLLPLIVGSVFVTGRIFDSAVSGALSVSGALVDGARFLAVLCYWFYPGARFVS